MKDNYKYFLNIIVHKYTILKILINMPFDVNEFKFITVWILALVLLIIFITFIIYINIKHRKFGNIAISLCIIFILFILLIYVIYLLPRAKIYQSSSGDVFFSFTSLILLSYFITKFFFRTLCSVFSH